MKTKHNIVISSAALLLMAIPLGAQAAATWDMYSECTSGCSTNNPAAGNTATFLSDSITMTSTAWSTAIDNASAGTTFATAKLMNWGTAGWGVMGGNETNATGPHAADNIGGVDLFALSFGTQKVSLETVKIGWNGNDNGSAPYTDADISVLAYTGSGTPAPSIAGKTIAQLLTSGWSLVGDYSNVGDSTTPAINTVAVNTGAVSSSWWLVSAYSSAYGGGNNWTEGNDAFKLLAVAGSLVNTPPPPPGVPEPAGVALLGLGLIGMVATRRKHHQTVG